MDGEGVSFSRSSPTAFAFTILPSVEMSLAPDDMDLDCQELQDLE